MTGAPESVFLGISSLGSRLPAGAGAAPRAHADAVKPVERLALPPPPSRDERSKGIPQIGPPADEATRAVRDEHEYLGWRRRRRRRSSDVKPAENLPENSAPQDVSAQGANHAYRRRVVANHGLDRANGRLINFSA
jgi:hypothetical protein